MALLLTGLAAGAVVGGVAGGKAIHNKSNRDKARRIMVDCGPYFLNEGITVQDLWTDFEKRLLKDPTRYNLRATAKMDRMSFTNLCRQLGYTDSLTYLLLRTWLEGKRNPELVCQPYLRAMNNQRYQTRACPELQSYLETAPVVVMDADDASSECPTAVEDPSRLVAMPKVRQPRSVHEMPPTRSEATPGSPVPGSLVPTSSAIPPSLAAASSNASARPPTYDPTTQHGTARAAPRRALPNGDVEEEW